MIIRCSHAVVERFMISFLLDLVRPVYFTTANKMAGKRLCLKMFLYTLNRNFKHVVRFISIHLFKCVFSYRVISLRTTTTFIEFNTSFQTRCPLCRIISFRTTASFKQLVHDHFIVFLNVHLLKNTTAPLNSVADSVP